MEKKRVLFMSVTAGQGHNSTCRAVMDSLQAQGVDCAMIDTMAYLGRGISKTVDKGYLGMVRFTPDMFGYFYRSMLTVKNPATREGQRVKRRLQRAVQAILSKKIIDYVTRFRPDVVVCSHMFAAFVCDALRAKGYLNAPAMIIVTDYTVHPYVEMTDMDYYVLASDLLLYQALCRGIPREKLLPFGIPVHARFSQRHNKEEMRENLGWENRRTLLIMGGSMGHGDIKHVVKKLDAMRETDFQMAVVCGKNKRTLRAISELETRKKVYCYGFTNQVADMMDASDVLITKPGGLTTSEALAKVLPLVLFSPIHGQEDFNLEFFTNNGMAMRVSDFVDVDEAVYQLLHGEGVLSRMRQAQHCLHVNQATSRLCAFITRLAQGEKLHADSVPVVPDDIP